jgi:hypothetical protein
VIFSRPNQPGRASSAGDIKIGHKRAVLGQKIGKEEQLVCKAELIGRWR